MNKAIEIEELRISSNGKHLEFIINCPADYRFTEFTIQVQGSKDVYSIADSLFYSNGQYIEENGNRFTGQVPVTLFGVNKPEIYQIRLEAEHVGNCSLPVGYEDESIFEIKNGFVYNKNYGFVEAVGTPESFYTYEDGKFYYGTDKEELPTVMYEAFTVNHNGEVLNLYESEKVQAVCEEVSTECSCGESYSNIIQADALISDVSNVYRCLMDDVLSLQAACTDKDAQDRVIRNYLILYAHQEALRLGYIDDAVKWFKLLSNCFGRCTNSNNRNNNISCGCTPTPSISVNNNCGCLR